MSSKSKLAPHHLAIVLATLAAAALATPALAGPPTPATAPGAPKQLRLAPNFHNPTAFAALPATTPMRSNNLGLACDARYAEQPLAVLELKAMTRKLQVTAAGAGAVAVVFNGRGACAVTEYAGQDPSVMLDEWPAGKVEIYVGDTKQNYTMNVALRFEELGRKLDLDWDTATDIPRVKLDAAPATPMVMHIPAGGPRTRWARAAQGCGVTYFRARPDFVLEVGQVVTDLGLDVRSHDDSTVLVVGPIPPDARNIPMQCLQQRDSYTLSRLEPGIYGIALGGDATAPAISNILLTGKATPRDPAAVAPTVPAAPALADRDILLHFPQLEFETLTRQDEVRFALFANAPRQLRVFVRRDLDASSASLIGIGGQDASRAGGSWPTGEAPARAFPRKDEPVLLVGGRDILTAEGNLFEVDFRDLAPAPAGPAALPDAPRIPEAGLSYAMQNPAGPAAAKLVKELRASNEAYDACNTMLWNKTSRAIEAIQAKPWRWNTDAKIESMRNQTERKVIAQCKLGALEKKRKVTWAKLLELRTARRAEALAAARKLLAETP